MHFLGRAQFPASRIGFGASPLGGVFGFETKYESEKDLQNMCNQLVQRAIDCGINVFDTSPYYGSTRSEARLGIALKSSKVDRNCIFLASKVGRYHHEHPTQLIHTKNAEIIGDSVFDFSRETVYQSVDESLKRLQLEYLDLVYCHDIEFADLNQVISEAIPALVELRNQGIIRNIGISGFPLEYIDYVL
jgi:L-galactose dehydrogenase